jgi:hypothetical protein
MFGGVCGSWRPLMLRACLFLCAFCSSKVLFCGSMGYRVGTTTAMHHVNPREATVSTGCSGTDLPRARPIEVFESLPCSTAKDLYDPTGRELNGWCVGSRAVCSFLNQRCHVYDIHIHPVSSVAMSDSPHHSQDGGIDSTEQA